MKHIKHLLLLIILFACNTSQKNNESSNKSTETCQGYGDEAFIRSKMDDLNRDIIQLSKVGYRQYYIRYISWSTGHAIDGDQSLDYSNVPCRD